MTDEKVVAEILQAASCGDTDLVEVICTAVADALNVDRGDVLQAVRAVQQGRTPERAPGWLRLRAYS